MKKNFLWMLLGLSLSMGVSHSLTLAPGIPPALNQLNPSFLGNQFSFPSLNNALPVKKGSIHPLENVGAISHEIEMLKLVDSQA